MKYKLSDLDPSIQEILSFNKKNSKELRIVGNNSVKNVRVGQIYESKDAKTKTERLIFFIDEAEGFAWRDSPVHSFIKPKDSSWGGVKRKDLQNHECFASRFNKWGKLIGEVEIPYQKEDSVFWKLDFSS